MEAPGYRKCLLCLSLGLEGIEQIWQLREFRLRGEGKRQGREGAAEESLSLERGEGSGSEIGLLDCEQMERHFILCGQKEGGEMCQKGFAMKP